MKKQNKINTVSDEILKQMTEAFEELSSPRGVTQRETLPTGKFFSRYQNS